MKIGREFIKQIIEGGDTSLGIEFGSTRIKAVLIGKNFETIATGSHQWENRLENGFWTYNLPDIITGMQTAYENMRKKVEQDYDITIETVGSIGISAMMHGYMAFDAAGDLLVPFRTWRNATTGTSAKILTDQFQFNIPERWSIAHLYQGILDEEKHLAHIDYMTTLSGYIHWLLTGRKAIGVGDASGMFPVNESTGDYNEAMLAKFDELISKKAYVWKLKDILPEVYTAGDQAGGLTEAGAKILDKSQNLQSGIPFCPPEGDAGTGMVATNSVRKRTGNISVGTSVFTMIVLEKSLSKVYPEIDLVTTPAGAPVAMVHTNNGSSDLDAWISLFQEFYEAMGQKAETQKIFEIMLNKALAADADGGGLLSYGYLSGENITGLEKGRPLFIRSSESNFNLANFMRTHLLTAFGALKIGMDTLTQKEKIEIDSLLAHGGLFKTPVVGQKIIAGAMNVPVSVMETAGEGGAWGMALLAAYMKHKTSTESLEDFLDEKVFTDVEEQEIHPEESDVKGFEIFMERYKKGLVIEQAAVDNLTS
ncbi:xylulokinase [Oceanobacillus oncorhynchi]|uniref:xylulokinase n=1 Tax=Oceanobacillus oncorhynchi TaxID=545501 RepID=UPI002115E2E0|nr:FGGY-family carbohydrate kinase [Oceanobacillus oncorhynchi]UUI40376.1 FGGY-family carbohydrate kinase [Oceanobacillus oncorhynchi]